MNLMPITIYSLATAAVFTSFVVVTLGGAVMAVVARRLVRSVCGLALSFLGLAGLYYFLHSPFLALMQMLIYVGAICITIMFAMMLTDPQDQPIRRGRRLLLEAASLLVAGLLAAGLITLLDRSTWMTTSAPSHGDTLPELGRVLLFRYGFAFELISVVLLLAILGALVVARSGRRSPS
ncbi:MAG: NADH-quinone oxidoreductase subunit J [Verrucomicrobia bacterium]|nr:MAG: NADH-quinone oxidoreductase subunit J [Verrucomicrobiota bacterium]